MDFVVGVLTKVFSLARLDAWKVMYEAHHNGRALVETVSQETARAHLRRAHGRARAAGYPLRFTMNRQ